MYLMPIEQDIINWRMENPYMDGVITGVLIALCVVFIVYLWHIENKTRKAQQERMKQERAAKRAWIKERGGL